MSMSSNKKIFKQLNQDRDEEYPRIQNVGMEEWNSHSEVLQAQACLMIQTEWLLMATQGSITGSILRS